MAGEASGEVRAESGEENRSVCGPELVTAEEAVGEERPQEYTRPASSFPS